MADIQPNIEPVADENDPEWERIKAMTPGLDTPAEEPVVPSEEEPEKKEEPVVETPVTEPVAEETPAEPVAAEPSPEEPAAAKRPEKYIPVQQYTSEKAKWKEEKERLETELSTANAARGQKKDDAIKAYAEKHDVTEESVRELLSLQQSEERTAPAELDEALQEQLKQAEVVLAEKAYDTEFSTVAAPELKKLYPNATPAQLEAAKKEIEKIACTADFLDKPLDFVVFKNTKDLAPIFATKEARRGPEQSRQAPDRGNQDLTADDFKDGKTSFEELSSLPGDKQGKIIEGMDVKTYDAYSRYISRTNTLTINRGGRKIEF